MKTQKKLFIGITGLFAALFLYFFGRTMRPFSVTVPLIVGPLTKSILIVLGVLTVMSAAFIFSPLTKERVIGCLLIIFGILWFCGQAVLKQRMPDSPICLTLGQWLIIPVSAVTAGILMWFDISFPELSEKWQLGIVLLTLGLVLSVTLHSGYFWDDAFFATTVPSMRLEGESVWSEVWHEIVTYARIGRLNPFATFHSLVFYFLPNAFCYKLFILLLTLADAWLFYRFIRKWKGSHSRAVGMTFVLALCFQLRLYHDPLNGYYGLMQVMFAELILSLGFFLDHLRKDSRRGMVLSLLFCLMGLLSYEMFYPFLAFYLLLAVEQEKSLWKGLRRMIPWIGITLVLFGLTVWLRLTGVPEENAYIGNTFSPDPFLILRTWLYQMFGGVPLSYQLSGYEPALFGKFLRVDRVFSYDIGSFFGRLRWQDLIPVIFAILFVAGGSRESRKTDAAVIVMGLLLMVQPGMSVSVSEKYQQDLMPGIAYIPVYFSYFGAAMLLYALFDAARGSRILCMVCLGVFCAGVLINQQNNRSVNEILNEAYLYPRQTGEEALHAGILSENLIGDGTVISDQDYSLWEHGWDHEPYQKEFYSLNAGRSIDASGRREFIQSSEKDYAYPKDTFVIRYDGNKKRGIAVSGRLRKTLFDRDDLQLKNLWITDACVFLRGYDRKDILSYYNEKKEPRLLSVEDAYLLSETDEGILVKIQENSMINFKSIGVLSQP